MQLQPGSVIADTYRVGAMIDDDEQTMTYRAVRLEDGEDFALKVILERTGDFQERLERAAMEAKERLDHPNVVRVHRVLDVQGYKAVLMDYVGGGDLGAWLQSHSPPLDVALKVFAGIVSGLGAAHAAGMVHRNLKPAKILMDDRHQPVIPRINDFTLVKIEQASKKLTQMGIAFGTPQYMAPEQFRDVSAVDRRADLFALGCILYEMVCGARTFPADDLMTIYRSSSEGEYIAPRDHVPDLPDGVVHTIDLLLKVDPAQRPSSCEDVLKMLGVAPVVPQQAPEVAPPPPDAFEDPDEPGPDRLVYVAVAVVLGSVFLCSAGTVVGILAWLALGAL